MLIDLENQTHLTVDMTLLEAIASRLTTQSIELILTDNATIAQLNQTHRNKATPTDVLSFPLETPFTQESLCGMPLGSVVISADFVKSGAKAFGHTEQEELTLLFIHGLLHLLGYDHECDSGEMRQEEQALIEAFGLPSSLIVRTV